MFAQPIFAQYAGQNQLELRNIVKTIIIKYACKPLVEFECPEKVDVAINLEDNNIIIHLLNPNPGVPICCGPMEVFESFYPRTFEYMNEILPIFGINIIINSSRCKNVESVGEGNCLSLENFKDKTIIRLDKLNLWETILINLD